MDNYPFSKVDLRRNAGALAVRLSSMNSFVEASQELLSTTRNMSGSERQRHSKKIIALIEIAHSTLTRAGIKLHTFTSCPLSVAPHKNSYFDLLRALECFRSDIEEPSLRERLVRLLFPLYSWFVINRDGKSTSQISRSRAGPPSLRSYRLSSTSRRLKGESSNLMPPPDAFPESDSSSRRRSLVTRTPESWSPQLGLSPDFLADEDDNVSMPIVYRPPSGRKFGIFCTANKQHPSHRRSSS